MPLSQLLWAPSNSAFDVCLTADALQLTSLAPFTAQQSCGHLREAVALPHSAVIHKAHKQIPVLMAGAAAAGALGVSGTLCGRVYVFVQLNVYRCACE